ncbi:MAG: tetratricopeptide repeat protein [Bacteroidota bacterium]
MFKDAETWFYFQDYENSLPLFQKVHEVYPENDNINYKIGFCYLNIDGKKRKAIPYLEKAAKNTTYNYTRESFYERKAPIEVLFYLGNAYRVDNQLDKAKKAYKKFEDKVKNRNSIFFNKSRYDFEYLQKQMEACDVAKEMMKHPVNYTAENLGFPINTQQSEFKPVVSGDGKTLVYTAEKKFYTGVFMSKKENGEWSPPVNLLPQLGIDGDCETTSISHDGKELYLYREDELEGNLYVSHFRNGEWSNIEKLGENISSKYWESHAAISADGQKLYFTSNREGGYGELDIYVSERQDDGTWGKAENLGNSVNSKWREDTPFITEDGQKLFFSSEGHRNMGGFDLFVSHKTSDGWSEPQNLGYPINSTNDDKFLSPANGGAYAYHSRFSKQAGGGKDIFKYNLEKADIKDYFEVEGVLTYKSQEDKTQEDFHINVINKISRDTVAKLRDEELKAKDITFKTPTGENHLIYESPKLKNDNQYIISQDYEIKERYLEPRETAELEEEEPRINLEKDVFRVQSGEESLKIKLQLKGGNKLVVNTFSEGKLINTEEFSIDKEDFTYEYEPKKEKSRLTFSIFSDSIELFSKDVNVRFDSLKDMTAGKESEAKLNIEGKDVAFSPENKKIKIRLSVGEGSRLFVETFVDDEIINKEEFDIDEDQFTYEYEPKEEKSRINFKIVDENQNVKNKDILISHKPVTNELKMLMGNLNQFSLGNVSRFLESYDSGSMPPEEFMDSLFSDTLQSDVKIKDIETIIYTTVLLSDLKAGEVLQKLQKMAAGKLGVWLNSISSEDFSSKEELIALMLQSAQDNSFSRPDINSLLGDFLARENSTDTLHKTFKELAQLSFQEISARLDENAIDISTPEELISFFNNSKTYESKQITAFLKGTELADIKAPAQKEITKYEAEEQPSKIILYILSVLVIGLLIIFIVTLIRRRRSNDSKN